MLEEPFRVQFPFLAAGSTSARWRCFIAERLNPTIVVLQVPNQRLHRPLRVLIGSLRDGLNLLSGDNYLNTYNLKCRHYSSYYFLTMLRQLTAGPKGKFVLKGREELSVKRGRSLVIRATRRRIGRVQLPYPMENLKIVSGQPKRLPGLAGSKLLLLHKTP